MAPAGFDSNHRSFHAGHPEQRRAGAPAAVGDSSTTPIGQLLPSWWVRPGSSQRVGISAAASLLRGDSRGVSPGARGRGRAGQRCQKPSSSGAPQSWQGISGSAAAGGSSAVFPLYDAAPSGSRRALTGQSHVAAAPRLTLAGRRSRGHRGASGGVARRRAKPRRHPAGENPRSGWRLGDECETRHTGEVSAVVADERHVIRQRCRRLPRIRISQRPARALRLNRDLGPSLAQRFVWPINGKFIEMSLPALHAGGGPSCTSAPSVAVQPGS
jgi:hypothetical protein